MEMMQNEMSARKGSLVEVVAEGDHLYVACVREPVPDLETLVLPRCKLQTPNPNNSRESEGFLRQRAPRSERSHLLDRGWSRAIAVLLLCYCCGERYTADSEQFAALRAGVRVSAGATSVETRERWRAARGVGQPMGQPIMGQPMRGASAAGYWSSAAAPECLR
jgi:hypothetical protein